MGAKRAFFWEKLDTKKMWYFVGLIVADGSLSKDGRHIDITSKYYDFLVLLRSELGIAASIGKKRNGNGQISYRIQLGSVSFYKYLRSLGIEGNKSTNIGEIRVPSESFSSFLRGLIDGDGCIRKWRNSKTDVFQWSLKISSGSKKFLEWLNRQIEKHFGLTSFIYYERNPHGGCYFLKTGNRKLLNRLICACYKSDTGLSLQHKSILALEFLSQ